MYLTLSDETMDSFNDPEVATNEDSSKLRLFRVGGDRPGKPQHRLDLWKRDLHSDQNWELALVLGSSYLEDNWLFFDLFKTIPQRLLL